MPIEGRHEPFQERGCARLRAGQHRRLLRVQSAGGAIYLRASAPIPPTRLQLQDVESGAILLDIAAEPAKDGQAPLEPVRIVEAEAAAKRYGGGAADGADEQADAPADKSVPRRKTPVPVVLTRHAAQNLYAPLRTVEPVAGIGRVNLRRDLALDTSLPTLPVHARALTAWRLEDQWMSAVRSTNTAARRRRQTTHTAARQRGRKARRFSPSGQGRRSGVGMRPLCGPASICGWADSASSASVRVIKWAELHFSARAILRMRESGDMLAAVGPLEAQRHRPPSQDHSLGGALHPERQADFS
jgi:hypothetical protein